MDDHLRNQAERMYSVYSELARAFQYRDRERSCCHGVSIAQCHALEIIEIHESVTMGELARALLLDASTATRMIDKLVASELVRRVDDPLDRRVCRIELSAQGKRVMTAIHSDLVDEQMDVLRQIPPEARESVINATELLLSTFRKRQSAWENGSTGTAIDCCTPRSTKHAAESP